MAEVPRTDKGVSKIDYPDAFTTPPSQPTEKKAGQLSQEQVKQFFEEGFLIVEDFFKPEELESCREACADLVDELAQKLYAAGKIDKLYEEYDVFHRLAEIEKAWPGAAVLLFKQGKMPKAFQDLWCHERLLNMVEQFIGPDIAGHPVWNLRIKPPQNNYTTVPWHQDSGYFSEDSYDHMVLIAWIPFLDTHENNGGMQMIRRAHKHGRVVRHTCCYKDTWFLELQEDELKKSLDVNMDEDVVTCRVPYGGFILFNNLTPHRSLHNITDQVRWSVDLRWQNPAHKWGFYDITEGVRFRSPTEGNIKPDFEKFLSINRKEVWQKRHFKEVQKTDAFDLTVTGPWIGRWDIINQNKHTLAFTDNLK